MRNKEFDKLLKEAIIQEAEEQGRTLPPEAEPIPEEAQARFDAALNGTWKKSKGTIDDMPSEQPQPVKRAHRWLAYGLTAVSAAAVVLVVALILGAGGIRATKAPEPADVQPPQAETTSAPLPEPGESEPEPEPEPEPEAQSEQTPAPGGMPLTPVEELPEIQTEAFTWNGYRCLMIAEYDVLYDVPNIIMFLPKNEEDAKDLPSIVYGLRPEEVFDDWDETSLREQIDVVLNNTGSGASDENAVLHSARTVYPGVVCRHVEYDKGYLCYAKVGTDGTKGLILYGLAATETGIDLYDRLVYAFIQMNGYPAKPTGRTEQTAQMRAFFEQNRELLESARTKNPRYYPDLMIEDGRGSYQRPYEDPRAVVETTNLPSELQVLAARSKEEGVTVYWEGRLLRHEPGQPFAEDSEQCFVVTMPESRDEAQSAYEVWLIHTENAQEQFAEAYRDAIEPLWGDWYLYVLYRESESETSAPAPEPESGEPLPYTSATFADENAAIVAMMRFYEENRTLLMAVAADLKAPEHAVIRDNEVYPRDPETNIVSSEPTKRRTNAIFTFILNPGNKCYTLGWEYGYRSPVFYLTMYWRTMKGYYSSSMIYSEDADLVVNVILPRYGGTAVETTASGAWGVYTPYKVEYMDDDGMSGVGTVRGNTTGNYAANDGRAVCDGENIYFVDQTAGHARIARYELATGKTTTLSELSDRTPLQVSCLNIYGDRLYCLVGWRDTAEVQCLDLRTGERKTIASAITDAESTYELHAVYDRLVLVCGNDTKVCDPDGTELFTIERFRFVGAMGGLLYGELYDENRFASYDLDGGFVKTFDLSTEHAIMGDAYAVNGYLITVGYENRGQGEKGGPTVLGMLNVKTGEVRTIRTGLTEACIGNFGADGIYLIKNGYLTGGRIYCLSWLCWWNEELEQDAEPECVDDRLYDLGPSLWDDTFLNDFVPCDTTADDGSAALPDGELVLKVIVNDGDPRTYQRGTTAFKPLSDEVEIRWEEDRCVVRYRPEQIGRGEDSPHYTAVPVGREIVVDIVYFDSGTQYRFWLAPEDAPLPDEWNAIIAENKRIADAQAIFGTQEAFEASRDREAEIGMIAALIPEYRQTYADAETDRFAEDWYWPLLDALWRNGDVTVQFTDAKRVDDGDSITLVLTGDNGKTYEMYVYMGWLEAVSCDGKLIRFLL